jgi:hypothetical protein
VAGHNPAGSMNNNRPRSWWRKLHRNYKVRRYRPKVWILPELDIGYIKVTKVASTSIELALTTWLHRQNQPGSESAGESKPDRELVKHYSAQYSHHFDPATFSRNRPAFVFAFVRNPLDRLHSSYVNKIVDVRSAGEKHNIFWNHGISLDMSFDDFVRRVTEIPNRALDRHLRSQSSCLYHGRTALADSVGHIEDLETGWHIIAERFNLPGIPHQNRSTRKEGASPYSRETALLAADKYREDIENFDYAHEIEALIQSL